MPPAGSLFVVFRTAATAGAGQRLVGWEDSDVGKHGLGLIADPGGRLHAILRNNGQVGRPGRYAPADGVRDRLRHLGPGGTTLHRNGSAAGSQKGDRRPVVRPRHRRPADRRAGLRAAVLGSAATSRRSASTTGNWTTPNASQVEAELHDTWFRGRRPEGAADATRWPSCTTSCSRPGDRSGRRRTSGASCSPPRSGRGWTALSDELEALKKKPPPEIPQAVVGAGRRPQGHAPRRLQGRPGLPARRPQEARQDRAARLPAILTGEHPERITEGSGRLQLADWLARPDNPLTARVMVNRIWQHHFGEGLVRTPNDFGERGERPTHPELLDYLAARFVESGWSVKAMHRLIMLSSAYQQSSRAERRRAGPRTRTTACSGG